jgi:hypothetical protein
MTPIARGPERKCEPGQEDAARQLRHDSLRYRMRIDERADAAPTRARVIRPEPRLARTHGAARRRGYAVLSRNSRRSVKETLALLARTKRIGV